MTKLWQIYFKILYLFLKRKKKKKWGITLKANLEFYSSCQWFSHAIHKIYSIFFFCNIFLNLKEHHKKILLYIASWKSHPKIIDASRLCPDQCWLMSNCLDSIFQMLFGGHFHWGNISFHDALWILYWTEVQWVREPVQYHDHLFPPIFFGIAPSSIIWWHFLFAWIGQ